jgi:hypothetical protein
VPLADSYTAANGLSYSILVRAGEQLFWNLEVERFGGWWDMFVLPHLVFCPSGLTAAAARHSS